MTEKYSNHFPFPYSGNKRSELPHIFEVIEGNMEGIKTIIEPYCGSSAFSFFLSKRNPKKYNYILNDADVNLIRFYNILKDEEKTKNFLGLVNLKLKDITSKDAYKKVIKEPSLVSWFIKQKIYSKYPSLYPPNYDFQKDINLNNCPIIDFLRNENVEILNGEGADLFIKKKDDPDNLIFLDPPYILSHNTCYDKTYGFKNDIYEYLATHRIENIKSKIILSVENNWIMSYLFLTFYKKVYEKKYSQSQKNTEHVLICNF